MTDFTFAQQVALAKAMPRIARLIEREMKRAGVPRMPWSLYTWGGHRSQHISNARREDVKRGMKETLDRWNEPEDPPLGGFY